MKKFMIACLVFALSLSGGAAMAAGKAKAKKKMDAPKKWDCSVGDKKVMTATLDECIAMGGLVTNFPAATPEMKAAPKAKAKAKAKKTM
jgi:hypothetical protein